MMTDETEYLLRSPENAARLRASVGEVDRDLVAYYVRKLEENPTAPPTEAEARLLRETFGRRSPKEKR